jgi:deoxyribodipyrimidine photo-lyase
MLAISAVWFKRDLRLEDHEPLCRAIASGKPVLLLYIFDPEFLQQPDSDPRHLRFIWQSLDDLDRRLKPWNVRVERLFGNPFIIWKHISETIPVSGVFGHIEVGNAFTWQTDKAVSKLFKSRNIPWFESPFDGVSRPFSRVLDKQAAFLEAMQKPLFQPDWRHFKPASLPENLRTRFRCPVHFQKFSLPQSPFQPGGTTHGLRYLDSFLTSRSQLYMKSISKPEASRKHCSRISPYLSYGNLSARQCYMAASAAKENGNKNNLNNFMERLRWRSHFINRFEGHSFLEHTLQSPIHETIRQDWNEAHFQRWESGNTGFPLVDACMRAVKATGYLNFRMRSMVVSFLTHHLWLDWRRGAHVLARFFLDYEPGIHYCQFQMQSATSGVHTIRVYNPVKQSQEHDPEGVFIKKWVPELAAVPSSLIHEPWKLTAMEQSLYDVEIGVSYPFPLVNHEETYRQATGILWQLSRK